MTHLWMPSAILFLTALVALSLDLISPETDKTLNLAVALLGTGIAAIVQVDNFSLEPAGLFHNMLWSDPLSWVASLIILGVTFLTLLVSHPYLQENKNNQAEYYGLILFASLGMLWMVSSQNLVTLFLALETFSLALYVLAGFDRANPRSREASLKYFLLSAFASGFLLYGLSLIYGATGSLDLSAIPALLAASGNQAGLVKAACVLFVIGLAFKVGAVPFHMWIPDTYEGAPTPVTAYLATAGKVAGFVMLIRVVQGIFLGTMPDWNLLWWVLALATMTVGNVLAIRQDNVKRMLAYSSIAQTGYILIGVLVLGQGSFPMVFYLFVYTLMTLGAFSLVLGWEGKAGQNLDISAYSGLGYKQPVAGFCMAVFMLSLTGVPPTGGFMAKFYLFSSAIKGGYLWLTILAVLNSAISAYYYLRILVYLYMRPESEAKGQVPPASDNARFAALLMALGVLLTGLWPSFFFLLSDYLK